MGGPLSGRVAIVAGATRGAGRGIAVALGEAGATVYCTGRTTRTRPQRRPETIEETAELVTRAGGEGVAVVCDHLDEAQVEALAARVRDTHGGADLIVDDIWGGDELIEFGVPVWRMSLDKGRRMYESGVWTHLINARFLTPLLFGRTRPLWIEITDGDTFGYRGTFFYDLVKMTVIRMAWNLSLELAPHGVTALAVTPGFLRSEEMLERFGVTEANWRDGARVDPHFVASESPTYVGRAVAALAADPDVAARNGRVFSSWGLAAEYGFTDADGSRPDWGDYFRRTFGRPMRTADEAAYASWRDGPWEIVKSTGAAYGPEDGGS